MHLSLPSAHNQPRGHRQINNANTAHDSDDTFMHKYRAVAHIFKRQGALETWALSVFRASSEMNCVERADVSVIRNKLKHEFYNVLVNVSKVRSVWHLMLSIVWNCYGNVMKCNKNHLFAFMSFKTSMTTRRYSEKCLSQRWFCGGQ